MSASTRITTSGCLRQGFISYPSAYKIIEGPGSFRDAIYGAIGVRHARFQICCRRVKQEQDVQAKVQGAWNLHNAFKNQTALDFFIMTSSLVTLVDQPGQGNYPAANTFLESFTQYRHKQGLPASVLGICPVDDIGSVAEIPALRKKLKAQVSSSSRSGNCWTTCISPS
ncbi:hypothetical protein Aspvir_007031 [Aspergillus viridinutans]|uniref:Ketoreductase domain-containing protein n=1 Tax=Aspergillus viridinutans TaxID=75553 RepID=A0A9P3F6F6_ASPVI|nr:uncharacterized protein Aspvir_007031 [Aspergillus viridinutans]GIK02966.1 hypothetical protein Aspvir_007031 [Aspergillus viridinutans]